MKIKQIVFIILDAAAVIATVWIFLNFFGQGPTNTIRVAMTYPYSSLSGLFFIADNQGYFEKRGLNVIYTPHEGGGAETFDALRRLEADVVFGTDFRFVTQSFDNKNMRVLGSLARSANRTSVVARRDRGILSIKDLRGKKIAVTPNSSYEYFLNEFLSKNGLSFLDMDLVYKEPLDAQSSFLAGETDAVIHSEPYLRPIRDKFGGTIIGWPAQDSDLLWLIVSEKSVIETHKDRLIQFITAILEAEEYLADFPAKAVKIIAESAGSGETEASISKIKYDLSFDESLKQTLEKEIDWWIQYKYFNKLQRPTISDFLRSDLLKEIKPEAVEPKSYPQL